MKVLPFSILKEYELCNELTPNYDISFHTEHPVITSDAPSVDSIPRAILPLNVDICDTNVSNEDCVDSFCHVYCDYISQNDVPDLMCTGDPSSVSI